MNTPIRAAYLNVITTGAGEIITGDSPSRFRKIVVEVYNRTFDNRAFLAISPEQAREMAADLVRLAELTEGGPS